MQERFAEISAIFFDSIGRLVAPAKDSHAALPHGSAFRIIFSRPVRRGIRGLRADLELKLSGKRTLRR
jgi:hypothetical protein